VLQLQRAVGNQAVDQLLAGTATARPVQSKGQPDGQVAAIHSDAARGIRRLPADRGHAPAATASQAGGQAGSLALPPVQSGSLARSEFEALMQGHFGVGRVFDGTQADQEAELRQASGRPDRAFNPANWQDWNPGGDSPIYAQIVNAFRQFSEALGGIPPVQEIGFFHTRYAYDPGSGGVVTEPNVAATFGAGTLLIYRYIERGAKALPTGRSDSGSAPLPAPLREQTVSRIITHELAHGLVEVALTPRSSGRAAGQAPDAELLRDYQAAVGWSSGSPPRLFDIGVPAVRAALAQGNMPDSAYEITARNWNEPRWVEQPISGYMTSHPSEDFPEAIMAYMNQPDLLRVRSPRRFQFILERALQLGPLLRQIRPEQPPKGDFPVGAAAASYA
jgi:hypothetical protein